MYGISIMLDSKRFWNIWIFRLRMLSLYCVTCVKVQGSLHALLLYCDLCVIWCDTLSAASRQWSWEQRFRSQVDSTGPGTERLPSPAPVGPTEQLLDTFLPDFCVVIRGGNVTLSPACLTSQRLQPSVTFSHNVIATFLILWSIATFFSVLRYLYMYKNVHENLMCH